LVGGVGGVRKIRAAQEIPDRGISIMKKRDWLGKADYSRRAGTELGRGGRNVNWEIQVREKS